jgi:hypothetical protein
MPENPLSLWNPEQIQSNCSFLKQPLVDHFGILAQYENVGDCTVVQIVQKQTWNVSIQNEALVRHLDF